MKSNTQNFHSSQWVQGASERLDKWENDLAPGHLASPKLIFPGSLKPDQFQLRENQNHKDLGHVPYRASASAYYSLAGYSDILTSFWSPIFLGVPSSWNIKAGRRCSVVSTKTLIYEVVGSSPGSGVSAPQGWGVGLHTWSQRHKGQADSDIKLGSVSYLCVSRGEMLVPRASSCSRLIERKDRTKRPLLAPSLVTYRLANQMPEPKLLLQLLG